MERLRVVHWGTGQVGKEALRGILRHPGLELVGQFAHSKEKVGRDSGELAGIGPVGIAATDDIDALLALDPDCFSYFGDGTTPQSVQAGCAVAARFLERGTNVVSPSLLALSFVRTAPADLLTPIADACAKGGSSLFISGADPGFGTTGLALGALSVVSELEQVCVREIADYSHYPYVDALVNLFGFSQPMGFAASGFNDGWVRDWWTGTVAILAEAIGVTIEEYRTFFDPASHPVDIDTGWLKIPAGTIAACRYGIEGLVNGRPVVIFEHITRMHPDAAPQWMDATPVSGSVPRHQYRCDIKGRPNLSVALDMNATADGVDDGLVISAMHLVNAIPAVCAARPGILSPLDLPAYTTRLG